MNVLNGATTGYSRLAVLSQIQDQYLRRQRVAVRDFDAQGSATKALKRFGGRSTRWLSWDPNLAAKLWRTLHPLYCSIRPERLSRLFANTMFPTLAT
jgi:hypothetical protein